MPIVEAPNLETALAANDLAVFVFWITPVDFLESAAGAGHARNTFEHIEKRGVWLHAVVADQASAPSQGRHVGRSMGAHIDLGLALLSCLLRPGESLTAEDMAAWCGCSRSAIQSIERRALAKVRERLVAAIGEEAVALESASVLALFGAAP